MMQSAMVIITLAVLIGLVGMEIKRPSKSHLGLRIVASMMAVVSLIFLILPLPFSKSNKSTNEIILLTEGYSKDAVDQLNKSKQKSLPQFQFKDLTLNQIADVSTIHLFGHGFKDTSQVQVPLVPILFHPTENETGIHSIHWQERIVAGSVLLVQGRCANFSNKTAKLVLYGWNQHIDSLMINPGKQETFSFSVSPKNEGRGLYHLALIAGKDSIEQETIPYQVMPAKPLRVLILGESPDFETKFLKNWLADYGYTVISKTTISKDKFQKTFSNTDPLNVDKLTSAVLDEQDLIVSDDATIKTLSTTELTLLKQSISDNGVGLILNADSLLSKKNFISELVSIKAADSNKAVIKISKIGETDAMTPILLKFPFHILEKESIHPLFMDQQKRIFASVLAFGKGKLIVNTLQKTSSWLLSGNKSDYRNYWTTLINHAAKKEMALESWAIKTELPSVNEAVTITAQTNSEKSPNLMIQQNEIYAKQNMLIPGSWEATYWPAAAGWQTMIGTSGVVSDWFVYPAESWQTLYADRVVSQTQLFLKNRRFAASKNETEIKENILIPPIYLLLIFLLSMAFLWAERKFQ
jgi:hypothetical protein